MGDTEESSALQMSVVSDKDMLSYTSGSSWGPDPNYYRQVSGVGAWGGECTCPDGQSYQVGDHIDACASLACEGGTAGTCQRAVDETRRGYKVTCAQSAGHAKCKDHHCALGWVRDTSKMYGS